MVGSASAPDATLVGHLDACLVCRACETACPSFVPFGRIMEGARAIVRERGRAVPLVARLGLGLLARPTLLAFVSLLASTWRRSGLSLMASRILPRRLVEMQGLLPAREGSAYAPRELPDATAQIFAGCVMRAAFGDSDRATERLVARSGFVCGSPSDQTCCGALNAHAGDADGARALARQNVGAFRGAAPVVVNAAGCGAHLKAYGEILADDAIWAGGAKAFAARVRDATELIRPAALGAGPARSVRVVYQDACHLAHGQRIRRQPRDLLASIPGIEVVPIADAERCCGSAGIYNLTHPDVARALQREKIEAIVAARPDVVVSANPGCLMQIASGLRASNVHVPVLHLARFLDDPAAFARPVSPPEVLK